MSTHQHIWVYAESKQGALSARAKELLGAGRMLADQLDEKVCCVLLAGELGGLAEEAIAFGADRVYAQQDPRLDNPATEICLQILIKLAGEHLPRAILLGRSPSDLAPRLALNLDAGFAPECIALGIHPENQSLLMTRAVYGGNAHAVLNSSRFPQIATLRPKAMEALERDDGRTGEVVSIDQAIDATVAQTRVIQREVEVEGGNRLEEAEVIVCGGRGIGGAEPFGDQLKALADVLGGEVGASRPPADDGWVPAALHIGLTGKVVAPNLYFAVGVSGASQHIAGCSGAKTIIAVNKDPDAYIFKHADYGVVGKWEEVLPVLTEKLQSLKTG